MSKFDSVYIVKQNCKMCGEEVKYLSTMNGAKDLCPCCGMLFDNALVEVIAKLEINLDKFKVGAVKIPCDITDSLYATTKITEDYLVEHLDRITDECSNTKRAIIIEKDVDPKDSVVIMDAEQYSHSLNILEEYEQVMTDIKDEVLSSEE